MDKIWYRAASGVAWVNGAPVPDGGRLHLTEAEAVFDLGLGRIAAEPVATAQPPSPQPEERSPSRAPRSGKQTT